MLPVSCLTLPILAYVEKIQCAATQDCLDEPYLRAARARGLRRHRIFFQYLLRPSLNPVVSTSGPLLGSILSGSLVLEVIFDWPGLGQVTYNALFNRDTALVVGCVVGSTILLVAGNLAADLLLLVLDPEGPRPGRYGMSSTTVMIRLARFLAIPLLLAALCHDFLSPSPPGPAGSESKLCPSQPHSLPGLPGCLSLAAIRLSHGVDRPAARDVPRATESSHIRFISSVTDTLTGFSDSSLLPPTCSAPPHPACSTRGGRTIWGGTCWRAPSPGRAAP